MNYLEVIKMLYDLEMIDTFKMKHKEFLDNMVIVILEDNMPLEMIEKWRNSVRTVRINENDVYKIEDLAREFYKKQMNEVINE